MRVSEQAKKRARELRNAAYMEGRMTNEPSPDALARVLQEHSDVAKEVDRLISEPAHPSTVARTLLPLILPDEPDAGDAFDDAWHLMTGQKNEARAKMAAAGFQIVRKDEQP